MKRSGAPWKFAAIPKASSVVVPAVRALWDVAWITGPSASGSLKGMPSSIRSAPPAAQALRRSTHPAFVGYPAVTNGTSIVRFDVSFSWRVEVRGFVPIMGLLRNAYLLFEDSEPFVVDDPLVPGLVMSQRQPIEHRDDAVVLGCQPLLNLVHGIF